MSICTPFLSLLIAFVRSKPENLITLDSSMPLAENTLISISYKSISFLEVVNFTISMNFSTGKFVPASTHRTYNAIWDLLASSVLSSARTVAPIVAKIFFIRFSSGNLPKTLKYSSTEFTVQ